MKLRNNFFTENELMKEGYWEAMKSRLVTIFNGVFVIWKEKLKTRNY